MMYFSHYQQIFKMHPIQNGLNFQYRTVKKKTLQDVFSLKYA